MAKSYSKNTYRISKVTSTRARYTLPKEVQLTQKIAKQASSKALRISKALDLAVQIIEKGKLIEIQADNSKKTIKEIEPVTSKIVLKKGTRLWLKPKE